MKAASQKKLQRNARLKVEKQQRHGRWPDEDIRPYPCHPKTRTTPAPKGTIIVFGILFWYPLAGVTYQFLHYLLALRRLG